MDSQNSKEKKPLNTPSSLSNAPKPSRLDSLSRRNASSSITPTSSVNASLNTKPTSSRGSGLKFKPKFVARRSQQERNSNNSASGSNTNSNSNSSKESNHHGKKDNFKSKDNKKFHNNFDRGDRGGGRGRGRGRGGRFNVVTTVASGPFGAPVYSGGLGKFKAPLRPVPSSAGPNSLSSHPDSYKAANLEEDGLFANKFGEKVNLGANADTKFAPEDAFFFPVSAHRRAEDEEENKNDANNTNDKNDIKQNSPDTSSSQDPLFLPNDDDTDDNIIVKTEKKNSNGIFIDDDDSDSKLDIDTIRKQREPAANSSLDDKIAEDDEAEEKRSYDDFRELAEQFELKTKLDPELDENGDVIMQDSKESQERVAPIENELILFQLPSTLIDTIKAKSLKCQKTDNSESDEPQIPIPLRVGTFRIHASGKISVKIENGDDSRTDTNTNSEKNKFAGISDYIATPGINTDFLQQIVLFENYKHASEKSKETNPPAVYMLGQTEKKIIITPEL